MIAEIERPAGAEQVDQPRRKVAAGQVAVPCPGGPTRHQPEADGIVAIHRDTAQRFFHIEEAEVVFAPLANHDPARLERRIRVEPVQFLINLML